MPGNVAVKNRYYRQIPCLDQVMSYDQEVIRACFELGFIGPNREIDTEGPPSYYAIQKIYTTTIYCTHK